MRKELLQAFKDIHECEQHNQPLLKPREQFNKWFKQLEEEGFIYVYKFNTYSIRFTTKGLETANEMMLHRIL
jgi:inorganic pyrophosphatase